MSAAAQYARPAGPAPVPGGCDLRMWEQLCSQRVSEPTRRWMIGQLNGYSPTFKYNPDRARGLTLFLNGHAIPDPQGRQDTQDFQDVQGERHAGAIAGRGLSTGDLVLLCSREGPPSPMAARQILAQPAADYRVVCAITHSVSNSWGGTLMNDTGADWEQTLARMQREILQALGSDQRAWVRVPARVRRRGLAPWHPEWGQVKDSLRGVRQAEQHLTRQMGRVAALGEPGWLLMEELTLQRKPTPLDVDAICTALTAASPVAP